VRFLLDNGITERYGTLLAGGALAISRP
jgi:hypothetical protein